MNLPNYQEAKKREKVVFDVESFVLDEGFEHIGKGLRYFVKTYG